MQQNTLITVVVPIYNVENYLAKCLDSIISQTYKNLEIICVDDCGVDGSMKILEQYANKDSRIKIISHDLNKGLGPARNTGQDAATGDYILFVDSDDTINLDILDKMLNSALKYNSDMVFANTRLVYEVESVKKRAENIQKYLSFKSDTEEFKIDIGNYSFYAENLPCVAWNKLYQAEFLKVNKIRFIDQKIHHEDEGYHVKVLVNSPAVSYVDVDGYNYLIRENSIMDDSEKSYVEKMKNMMTIVEDAITYIRKNNIDTKYINLIKNRPLFKQSYKANKFSFKKLRRSLFKIKWKKSIKIIKIFGVCLYEKKY